MDRNEFKEYLRKKAKENREAFEGRYKDELNQLMGLSVSEINEITPDTTDLQIYTQLTTIVKEASRMNISQANLKSQIEELGEIAIKISKKVPTLTALFV